jgi:hypothetical protein
MNGTLFRKHSKNWLYLIIITVLISGCLPGTEAAEMDVEVEESSTPAPVYAEVSFAVNIPSNTPASEGIFLEILDEITGLGLNPLRYQMEPSDLNHYTIRIPLVVGSVIKYRYTRHGPEPTIEHNARNEPVRYRLFIVEGKSGVNDIVCGWTDQPYEGNIGRITGHALDSLTSKPAPNILITAGGASSITASDGTFVLDGLSEGTHNIVAYSMEGEYQPFQQGAVVAADSATPTNIELDSSQYVTVTFMVTPPAGSVPGIPIRIIGNLYQFGNTFADLGGGMSTVASRAPYLTLTSEGVYVLMLSLPAGLDLRYKYSLGDGFWNGEHSTEQPFLVRQLIVPHTDVIVQDDIETWYSGDTAPITFSVNTPEDTPESDSVSIQFNPYSWTQPIPMWPLGDGQWVYMLYSPQEMLGDVGYRFCRNDQCGIADEKQAQGAGSTLYSFSQSPEPITHEHVINSWAWWTNPSQAQVDETVEVTPRGKEFIKGIELQKGTNPTWQPYIGWGLDYIQDLGANSVIVTPTWSYTHANLPSLEMVPGKDILWPDVTQMCFWAEQRNLETVIFPKVNSAGDLDEWWLEGERDAGWWKSWQDRYETFVLHHADLASEVHADAFIIGGNDLGPAMPGGLLADGTSSGVPADIENWWNLLITNIRTHYAGDLFWAIPYSGELSKLPDFIVNVDSIYVMWSAPLSDLQTPTHAQLEEQFGKKLDTDIVSLKDAYDKPIVIGLDYPSVDGSSAGCFDFEGACLSFSDLDQPIEYMTDSTVDMQEQYDIYSASLTAINQREWVSGFISRGFYLPAAVRDNSSSVHGKETSEVLRYWFTNIELE